MHLQLGDEPNSPQTTLWDCCLDLPSSSQPPNTFLLSFPGSLSRNLGFRFLLCFVLCMSASDSVIKMRAEGGVGAEKISGNA
jgi:hypothetical protein